MGCILAPQRAREELAVAKSYRRLRHRRDIDVNVDALQADS